MAIMDIIQKGGSAHNCTQTNGQWHGSICLLQDITT